MLSELESRVRTREIYRTGYRLITGTIIAHYVETPLLEQMWVYNRNISHQIGDVNVGQIDLFRFDQISPTQVKVGSRDDLYDMRLIYAKLWYDRARWGHLIA